MKWYVMRAISGKEAKVKEYIEAEIRNNRLGSNVAQVLIPTEKKPQKVGTKTVIKERNLLPGYVLVQARLVGEIAHELRQTPNVLGFLGGLDNPSPMQQSEVDELLRRMAEVPEENLETVIPFEVGDKVKVGDGPFSGFAGEVEEVNADRQTLTVAVKVFGRSTPLSLSFTQVVKE